MNEKKIIRVFPKRTSYTPNDEYALVGSPPFAPLIPEADEVHVSVTFTWDRKEGERLYKEWSNYFPTKLGGPAYDDPGGEFTPNKYVGFGCTLSTRGCIRKCSFCFVPKREGSLRLLKIKPGYTVIDNNLMAAPMEHFRKVFDMLRVQKDRISFTGGIDVRLMDEEKAELFNSIKIGKIFMAYDSEAQYKYLVRACELLKPITKDSLSCYVLVGYKNDTPEKAEERLRKAYYAGCYPYMMFYKDDDGTSKYEMAPKYRELKRHWANRQATYMHIKKLEEGDRNFKNQMIMKFGLDD